MNKLIRTGVLMCALATVGCYRDFGTGGTGELVVPQDQLREVQNITMADLPPSEQPTTSPSTVPTTMPSQDIYKERVELSLADIRQMALRNNLDLQVQLFNPAIAQTQLSESEAAFEAAFAGTASYTNSDRPPGSISVNRTDTGQSDNLNITPRLNVPLRTGGSINVALPYNKTDQDNVDPSSGSFDPQYSQDARISLSHDLLRGAGVAANAERIRISFYATQQAEARTKLEVIRVLAEVERAYWRLYAAHRELEVRRQQYDLANAQLERARREVNAGVAAEVEITRAESGAADTVQNIIIADNLVRDRERDLKRILNEQGLEIGSPTLIIPVSPPVPLQFRLNPERLAVLAMDNRMEMLDLELQIAADAASVDAARNGVLPLVALEYTYNPHGLGPADDDAWDQMANRYYVDHTFGLSVEVPIGNQGARARLRRSLLNRLQTLATQQQRELQIRQEVYNAVDQLEASWQSILAAQQRVILAQRLLEVENRQFEQGLRTSTEVLDAQVNLANAQSAEIASLTQYQISQVDIAFATGVTLGASRVRWEPVAPPPNED